MPRHRGGSTLGAVAHGSGACCASPLRRLRAGTVARRGDTCCVSLCDTSVSAQGFFSSNHRGPPPSARRRHKVSSQDGAGADGCGSGRMYVAFPLAWREPSLELLQTGVDLHRKARGPCASTKVEPANDRPSPRSVLVQTSTRPSAAPGCQAGFSASRVAIGLASGGSWQRQGHSHSKPKKLFSCNSSCAKEGPPSSRGDAG